MADDSTARVAENIRVELARRKLTQKDLAEGAGISEAVVSRRLNLVDVAFRVDQLERIAAFLGVPPSVLLGEQATA